MNIFKSCTFTWYQLGALKWAAFLIGIAAGAVWADRLVAYALHFFILGLILSVYVSIPWLRQIK